MADINALPIAVYANGAYTIPETAIGDSITSLQIAVNFNTAAQPTVWPDAADRIRFDIEVFTPALGWQVWNSPAEAFGGPHIVKGEERPLMLIQGSLPAGTGRRIRGTVTIAAQAPRTGIRTGCVVTIV
jgi:hypothetical protein